MDNLQERTLFGLRFDESTKNEIKSIATWAGFIAYTVFVFLLLIFLVLIFAGTEIAQQFSALNDADAGTARIAGTMMVLVFGFFMAVFGVWFYFLFKASRLFKKAVATTDVYSFNEGVKALNVYFIIGIVFMVLSLMTGLSGLF